MLLFARCCCVLRSKGGQFETKRAQRSNPLKSGRQFLMDLSPPTETFAAASLGEIVASFCGVRLTRRKTKPRGFARAEVLQIGPIRQSAVAVSRSFDPSPPLRCDAPLPLLPLGRCPLVHYYFSPFWPCDRVSASRILGGRRLGHVRVGIGTRTLSPRRHGRRPAESAITAATG